jgi:SAM-dependent methyltransferase
MHDILETGFDRPAKNIVREAVFEGLPRLSSVLTLPSSQRLCIDVLRANGQIDDDTQQLWVEIDGGVADLLREIRTENTEVFEGALESFTRDDLRKLPSEMTFDLINADTMASFGQRQALALQSNLAPALTPGGTVILWCTGWARNPKVMEFRDWFFSRLNGDLSFIKDDVMAAVTDAVDRAEIEDMYDRDSTIESLVLTIAMARCALARYSYRVSLIGAYRDGVPMIVVRLDDVRLTEEPNPVPLFSEILAEYQPVIEHKISDEESEIKRMIFQKSNGSHQAILFDDGDQPRWMLLSPTGKTLKSSKSISGIASYYQ